MPLIDILMEIYESEMYPNKDNAFKVLYNIEKRHGDEFAIEMAQTMKKYAGTDEFKELLECIEYATEYHKKVVLEEISEIANIYLEYEPEQAIIMINRTKKDPAKFDYARRMLREDKVLALIEQYKDYEHVGTLIGIIGEMVGWHSPASCIFDKIDLYSDEKLKKALYELPSWPSTEVLSAVQNYTLHVAFKYVEMFKKYKGQEELLCEAIDELDMKNFRIDELLRESAYQEIKKTDDLEVVKRIATQNYKLFRNKIKDKEFREQLDYKILERIMSADGFIGGIHRQRLQPDKQRIQDGFFEELNRVISQGCNYHDKISLIKDYCREVTEKIFNQADELTVVTNGTS